MKVRALAPTCPPGYKFSKSKGECVKDKDITPRPLGFWGVGLGLPFLLDNDHDEDDENEAAEAPEEEAEEPACSSSCSCWGEDSYASRRRFLFLLFRHGFFLSAASRALREAAKALRR